MKTTKATARIRKTVAVIALAGAIGIPVATASPGSAATAAAKGFENMPPA